MRHVMYIYLSKLFHVSIIFHAFPCCFHIFTPQDWSLLCLLGGVLAAPMPCFEVPEGPCTAARGRGHRSGPGWLDGDHGARLCVKKSYGEVIPPGKLTQLWKITVFHGKTHYKWSFSIVMLNCLMVFTEHSTFTIHEFKFHVKESLSMNHMLVIDGSCLGLL